MKLKGTHQRSTKQATRRETGRSAGRAGLIAGLAIVAAVLGGAAYGVSRVEKIDTIFPNVTIDGLNVGGMSIDEAAALLERSGYASVGDNAVTVELPLDVSLTVRADEVCTETPVDSIARMAYNACKGGSAVEDALTWLRCRTGGMALESGAALTVDEAAVRGYVENAAMEVQKALLGSDLKIGEDSICVVKGANAVRVDTEALTAEIAEAFRAHRYETISYDAPIETDTELDLQGLYDTVYAEKADAVFTDQYEIEPETVGISFDMEEAGRLWDKASYGDEVIIPLIIDEPEVTAAELEKLLFRDQLSTMSTSLSGSSSNRINNVRKAAGSINEIILLPGEEFSYNPALGKRTAENGYLPAGAYSGGEVVQEYGGGICQVSSTLYYCALYANLKITARTCHYFPVGYILPGMDATVSWGGPEFKFVNNREYPIKIVASVDEKKNTVSVELWGTDTDGSYVEMTYGTSLVYDEEYPEVAIGYKAFTTRTVFDASGKQLSRKQEANSYYHYHPEDIKWPEEPEETEVPQPTEAPQPVETAAPKPEESPVPTTEPEQPSIELPGGEQPSDDEFEVN